MKLPFSAMLLLSLCSSVSFGQVIINEIRINDPDTDDFEYFEIFNRGQSAINLDTISYLVIGAGTGGSGVVQQAHDLPRIFLDPGSTYLVSKQNTLLLDPNADGIADTTARPDLELPLAFVDSSNVTHLLVVGFTGDLGDDLDTNDDGTLDSFPWIAVSDAVSLYAPGNDSLVYATAISASFESAGPDGDHIPSHVFRVPNGGAWTIGTLGQEHNPGAGNLLQNSSDSPGSNNPTVAPLRLTLSSDSVSEGDPNPALTGTVTRPGTSGEVELTVTISDESEATVLAPLVFAAGESTVEFAIHVVDDRYPDGAQTVTVSVSGPGLSSAEESFQVTDDLGDSFSLVFNEVYYVDDPNAGDVNGDGRIDGADHFIEIVNLAPTPIDLSGFRLENSTGTDLNEDGIHRFPPGTILQPGCSIVVFGGEGAVAGTTTAFGTSEVQISSNNGLGLDVSGDILRLLDDSGLEVHFVELPDLSSAPVMGSLNLISEGPSGDPALGYDLHSDLAAGEDRFSPGADLNLAPFCATSESLTITLLDGSLLTPLASIPEDAPPGSIVARIEAPNRVAGSVVHFRISSALGELVPAAEAFGTLDDTNPTMDLPLEAVDNSLAQGSRVETISVSASHYFNSEVTIEVQDDGDLPPFTEVVINEVDADQAGGDDEEFVELYNLSGLDRSMDGLLLVLINGNGDSVYHVTDLSGFVIPAQGFFVIGHDSVPNVDLIPAELSIQNGADAVAIYRGDPGDIELGVEISSITNILVDAVVYDTNDGEDDGLLDALTPDQPQINESGGGGSRTESIQRDPDGGTQLDTSTFLTRSPTPGRSNQLAPDERLVDLDFEFGGKLLVATVSDLRPGTTYTMEASTDGGDTDPFVSITSFTTEDRNVIKGEDALFQIYIIDGFLGDLVTNPTQFYRLTKP